MKKMLSLILLILTIGINCKTTDALRKLNDPKVGIIIRNKKQLMEFTDEVNRGKITQKANIKLACKIDIKSKDRWKPIGTKEFPFMGNFYGGNNEINQEIISSNDNVGLFGVANNASFKNFTINGTVTGNDNVAALLG